MGRAASHIALECALQTHPNITIIGEEVIKYLVIQIYRLYLDLMLVLHCVQVKRGKYNG